MMWAIKHKSGRVLFVTSDEFIADNRRKMGWIVEEAKMTSREQFEKEYAKHYQSPCQFERHDKSGDYVDVRTRAGWRMWQASRAAIEIELNRKAVYASGYGDGYMVDSREGDALEYDETVESIESAGLKVKK